MHRPNKGDEYVDRSRGGPESTKFWDMENGMHDLTIKGDTRVENDDANLVSVMNPGTEGDEYVERSTGGPGSTRFWNMNDGWLFLLFCAAPL